MNIKVIPDPRTDAELVEQIRAGDRVAADILVRRHAAMVIKHAGTVKCRGEDRDDLIQVGLAAILRAAEKWDSNKGSKFFTYAFAVVRNAVFSLAAKLLVAEARATLKAEWDHVPDLRRADPVALPDLDGVEGLDILPAALITAYFGLNGEPVKITALANRYGLTPKQAEGIINDGLERLRRLVVAA